MAAIPTTVDDLTPAWFNAAVDLGGTVSSASGYRIGEGVGLLSQLFRMELGYSSGSGPDSVIVKLASPLPQLVDIAKMYGFYDREVCFYRHAAAQFENVPACYLSDMHESSAPFVIVMEDMARYRMVDQLIGCEPDDAHNLVRAAARIHAKYWANDALDGLTWLPPANNPMYKGAQREYNRVYDGFAAKYGAARTPYEMRVAEAMRTKTNTLQDFWCDNGPLTLAHYDMRLDNVMFGDGGDVHFIDWQLSAKQLGAFDIAYFIGWSMTDAVRRSITPSLIATYHDELLAQGVTGYDRQRCEDDIRRAVLAVSMMGAYASIAVPPENERGQAIVDIYVERAFATAEDMNALELLP